MNPRNTFVGFGFGAIQAGLFLYEAHQTGRFGRMVVAEVNAELVAAVRAAGNRFTLNIAHPDRIERAVIGPVELYNPAVPGDRAALVDAIADASELATALPSVNFYAGDAPGSVHRLLAEGFSRRQEAAVVYTAENNNHAAEILEAAVRQIAPEEALANKQFLNTVIGKMSGVVAMDAVNPQLALAPLLPEYSRAFLVEEFNRILVTSVHVRHPDGAAFERAIHVFEEKADLLPFEEAKLYGHNAIHAVGGYLAALLGMKTFAELAARPDVLALLRTAFIDESGAALIRKHAGVDALFTPAGFAAYADDLLVRMVNPYLDDAIERVTRDTERKLGWNDRLIGAMRLVISQGVAPNCLALGAAAALASRSPSLLDVPESAAAELQALLQHDTEHEDFSSVAASVLQAAYRLAEARKSGFKSIPTR